MHSNASGAPSVGPIPVPARRGWREAVRVWWSELDRVLLLLVGLLMAMGIIAVLAASPASADQLSTSLETLDPFRFLKRHLAFLCAGLGVMVAFSFLSRDNARRAGLLVAIIMFALLMLVPLVGFERKGATRWLDLGLSLQPSEFLKPAFAITLAWILSWRMRDPHLPVFWLATGLTLACASLLMLQPNLGETLLFVGTWFVLIFLAGVSAWRMGGIVATGLAALTLVYFTYENGRARIDDFLGGGTAFDQVDLANRTLLNGGWSGNGLWLGTRKYNLPEAHTDYIFSVIGEEFGLLVCALVVILYLALIARVLVRLAGEEDMFAVLAGTGLIAQFGGQAFINMAVNLRLAPATGTTLPLISYGGSSMLAVCFTLGLLLAITRRNPFLERDVPGIRTLFERKEAPA
ncbi:MAG: putative peptidoglycan glycosyltransferase FtsW [Erythrobacter sp.]|uniref:FtsW/RodA/SpoVE family cell cycle protein n=1 Tax=Erythrobacter sp. TaxID=1042 RepID=UPI002635F845|nr:putative peptidoglycan glycosyltransferase FtsW [Erythrobacter sp.]MDJ0979909.1 putative peptidoglycan glycosyltransferase FtsW [Erythrobacter sp.]